MQDPLLDPLRQRILARMGIPLWQQRGRLLAGGTSPDGAAQPANTPADEALAPQETAPLPTGKLLIYVGVNNDAQSTLSRDLLHPGRALFALWRWQTSASPGAEMTDNESGAGPEAGPRHHG